MIQILHLIDTYRIGGPGKTIINSAKYIDQRRYRVHVASFTNAETGESEFGRAVRAASIPYLELRETGRFHPGHVRLLRRYVHRENIRIVHAHGYKSDLLGFLATRGFRSTRVVSTHHGWIRNNARQQIATSLALVLCRRLDGIEVVSTKLLDDLPRSVRTSGRTSVVHNGIVIDDFVPRGERDRIRTQLELPPDAFLVAVVGRLSPEKGCQEMLDAFREVALRIPRAYLAFVGEGPLAVGLGSRIRELDLEGRVFLIGYCAHVQPYYEAMDLLVSPSLTEGLSNVVLEAQAFGKPVVATRVGGNAEIVDDRTSGLLVEPAKPVLLTSAIMQIIEDEPLRQHVARNGFLRVSTDFTFQARMRKEEMFYSRVLGGPL